MRLACLLFGLGLSSCATTPAAPTLTHRVSGKITSLDGLRGKVLVLNFWAGQCPPCRAEMPDFQRVYDRRRGDFLLLGIDVGAFVGLGDQNDARRLLRDLGIRYPTAATADARIVQDYRVLGMPTTVFIGRDGRVAHRVIGVLNAARLEQQIDLLVQ